MDEIREVEAELRRLREDAVHYKKESDALKKEKKTLESKNEYLVNKLKEASYVYGEAGKRLLYFINNQVNPVTKRLNDLDARGKKLSSQDKALGETIISLEKTLKDDFTDVDKRLKALNENISAMQEKVNRAIKASVRKSEHDDEELGERITAAAADFDESMKSLQLSLDRKLASRISASEKKTETKLDTLKEHSLIMRKDIEALKKFEGDIEGLEEKLQTTVSNLTQTRLDMEKLAQKVRSDMEKTRAGVDDELVKMTNDVNTKLLEFSSDLRQADEKNMGEMKLAAEQTQQELDKKLQGMTADVTAFENAVNTKIRTGQAAMKKEQGAFERGVEKRLQMLESNITANTENHKEMQKMLNEKVESLVRHDDDTAERLEGVESALMEHIDKLRELGKRREVMTRNEMQKIGKSADQKVGHAALQLERKIGLLGKDIDNLKSLQAQIGGLAAEIGKRKEETASLRAKVNEVSQEVTDKSEKADMGLKEQMEVLQSEVRNRLESAESRIVKENVRSFSKVRQNLKKDVHALREENASLKADVRNLQKMGAIVNDLQQAVVAAQKKVDDTLNSIEQVSAGVSGEVEKQALKVSKDMAGISAGLKADLRDIIAREKERFAGQSAELDAKYAELSKKAGELEGQASGNSRASGANRKSVAALNRKVNRLMREIVGLKKEYKVEMGRLLKELEG
jgi:chromosome segregation ATPase